MIPPEFEEHVRQWRIPFDPAEFRGWHVKIRNRFGKAMTLQVTGRRMTAFEAAEHVNRTTMQPLETRAVEHGAEPQGWHVTALYAIKAAAPDVLVFDTQVDD